MTIVEEGTATPGIDSRRIGELAVSAAGDVRSREAVFRVEDLSVTYSGALALQDDEWLTIAARRSYDRPLIAPADTDARTVMIRIRGGDLGQRVAVYVDRRSSAKRTPYARADTRSDRGWMVRLQRSRRAGRRLRGVIRPR